jgi:hypothetical protein
MNLIKERAVTVGNTVLQFSEKKDTIREINPFPANVENKVSS